MGKLLGQLSGVFIPLAALSLTAFIKNYTESQWNHVVQLQ